MGGTRVIFQAKAFLVVAAAMLCCGGCRAEDAAKRLGMEFGIRMPVAWDYTSGTFLAIEAAGEWTLAVACQDGQGGWTTLEDTRGEGDAKIWFTTTCNTSPQQRAAVATLTAAGRKTSARLTQQGMEAGEISATIRGAWTRTSVGWESCMVTVDVATAGPATDWIASASEGQDWCRAATTASGRGNGSVTFFLGANASRRTRDCMIRVSSGQDDLYLDVRQRCRRPELPAIAEPAWFRDYAEGEYALEYSILNRGCKWVAWRMHAGHIGESGRNEDWHFDTTLAPYNPVYTASGDYKAQQSLESGTVETVTYSRGHVCPSNDRTATAAMNRQTFCYANMLPQIQNFNSGIWSSLETRVHNWAAVPGDTLYVCAGGHGIALRTMPSLMAVPQYFFKVILRKKSDGQYDAVGFWMEHKAYEANAFRNNIGTILKTVREVEALTGLDFFRDLDPALQHQVETKAVVRADWGLPN